MWWKRRWEAIFRLLTKPQEKRPEPRCTKPDSPPCSPLLFANKHRTLSLPTVFAHDPQHHYYGCLKFCSPFTHICSPGKLREHRHREGGRDERRNWENEGERENAEAKFAYHIRREVGERVLEQMSICIFNSGLAERGLGDVSWTLAYCVGNLSECMESPCAREGAQVMRTWSNLFSFCMCWFSWQTAVESRGLVITGVIGLSLPAKGRNVYLFLLHTKIDGSAAQNIIYRAETLGFCCRLFFFSVIIETKMLWVSWKMRGAKKNKRKNGA